MTALPSSLDGYKEIVTYDFEFQQVQAIGEPVP